MRRGSWASPATPLGLATRHTRRLRMVARMIIGLGLTVVALALAGQRLWFLKRLAFSGQPAPERLAYVREHPGADAEGQLTEVIGQRKLLKWTVPGMAHAATF